MVSMRINVRGLFYRKVVIDFVFFFVYFRFSAQNTIHTRHILTFMVDKSTENVFHFVEKVKVKQQI